VVGGDAGRGAPGSDPDGDAGAPTPSGGFGLVGMRQRAALLEGSVDAGPDESGGFRVAARLPVHGS
jgi:signal transduction histidine kinase